MSIFKLHEDLSFNSAYAGTLGAQPASGTLALTYAKRLDTFLHIKLTFTAFRLTVTDAAASGSSASAKVWTFPKGLVKPLLCRHAWTAFAEGSALTTAAGDAAFVIAFGSVAADAGDAALTGTEVDLASITGTLTNSGGTTTGSKVNDALSFLDGSSTAKDMYLNWSGSAASIDANSTIDCTGTLDWFGVILQNA